MPSGGGNRGKGKAYAWIVAHVDIQLGRTRTGQRRPPKVLDPAERPRLAAESKALRQAGKTWDFIAKRLGIARLTARTLASEQ